MRKELRRFWVMLNASSRRWYFIAVSVVCELLQWEMSDYLFAFCLRLLFLLSFVIRYPYFLSIKSYVIEQGCVFPFAPDIKIHALITDNSTNYLVIIKYSWNLKYFTSSSAGDFSLKKLFAKNHCILISTWVIKR